MAYEMTILNHFHMPFFITLSLTIERTISIITSVENVPLRGTASNRSGLSSVLNSQFP